MPVFPSQEWCDALVAAIHADPESAKAGKGFVTDLAAVVLPEGTLKEPFAVYAKLREGRVESLRVLEDLDEVDEIEPKYVGRAGYATWLRLIRNELDPIEAVLHKQIAVSGDLAPIIERAQFKELVRRVLAKVPTAA